MVQFRNPIPAHYSEVASDRSHIQRAAGQPVRILLPPYTMAEYAAHAVGRYYTCDSEFVWQIHPTDVARFKPQSIGMRVFVCIHQVEID